MRHMIELSFLENYIALGAIYMPRDALVLT
jgi:hypothetical protein